MLQCGVVVVQFAAAKETDGNCIVVHCVALWCIVVHCGAVVVQCGAVWCSVVQ